MTKPHISSEQLNKIMRVNRLISQHPALLRRGAPGGLHAGGLTKTWADFSYPVELDFDFYLLMYKRTGIGRAVVQYIADLCWLNKPTVKIGDRDDDQIARLARRLRLWSKLKQMDVFQRVGHYAGCVIEIADGKNMSESLEPDSITLDDIESVTPAWESQLVVGDVDQNIESERYGLPDNFIYYQDGTRNGGGKTVHHSRVWIMAEGSAGNSIYGESVLESVYNSILSWSKITGAGGEGFLRQASARNVLKSVGENTNLPTQEQLDSILEAMEDMQQDPFSAIPFLGNMDISSIQSQLSNPEHFLTAVLNDIAAGAGVSAKALIGAQEGRLAGEQDGDNDRQMAQSRCDNYLSDVIMEKLDWLALYCRDFNESESRTVEFPDLMAPSDKSRFENAKLLSDMNQAGFLSLGDVYFTRDEIREAAGFESDEDEFTEAPYREGE